MATAVVSGGPSRRSSSQLIRKYPPLLTLAVVVFIALVVLPSSLNLPQTSPTTTLEYAPVPPDDSKNPPPPNGNLSSLGLAGSSSLQSGGLPGGEGGGAGLPTAGAPPGVGKSPQTKRCVGNPPRQTEDPLAPPCVADFRGDNFGSTYQGVTKDEVVILFYIQGFTYYVNTCRDSGQTTPDRQYFDLAQPAQPGEHCMVRVLRTYQTYFNDRYQTYGRFVHFWAYFSSSGNSGEERRSDAADNYNKLHPFAVISTANTFNNDYLDNMASRGVLNFGSFLARDNSFYNQYPKLVWGYPPSLDQVAKIFVAYLCKKVANHPVDPAQTNSPTDGGKKRVFGYWHSGDPAHPELIKLADQIKSSIASCGITFAADDTFPEAGFAKSAHYAPTKAQQAVADYQNKQVTTVIWPGGLETNFTQQADNANFRPEIIALGDGLLETTTSGGFQAANVWDKARMVTNGTFEPDIRQDECYTAYKEADPEGDDTEAQVDGCPLYPLIRQLFTGIQVAGPRLGPTSIDKGFHAIPRIASTNPSVPACFYETGDYTCVKDATVERWDRTGRSTATSGTEGCYRATERGKRYFADIWPDGNTPAQDKPDDPCNTYNGSYLVNPAPPSASNPGG